MAEEAENVYLCQHDEPSLSSGLTSPQPGIHFAFAAHTEPETKNSFQSIKVLAEVHEGRYKQLSICLS